MKIRNRITIKSKRFFFVMSNLLMLLGLIIVFQDRRISEIRSIDMEFLTLEQWVVFLYAMALILIGLISNIGIMIWYAWIVFKDKKEDKEVNENN